MAEGTDTFAALGFVWRTQFRGCFWFWLLGFRDKLVRYYNGPRWTESSGTLGDGGTVGHLLDLIVYYSDIPRVYLSTKLIVIDEFPCLWWCTRYMKKFNTTICFQIPTHFFPNLNKIYTTFHWKKKIEQEIFFSSKQEEEKVDGDYPKLASEEL